MFRLLPTLVVSALLLSITSAQDRDIEVVLLDPEAWGPPTYPTMGAQLPLGVLWGPPGEEAWNSLFGGREEARSRRDRNLQELLTVLVGEERVDRLEIDFRTPLVTLRGTHEDRQAARNAIRRLEDGLERFTVRAHRLNPTAWDAIGSAIVAPKDVSGLIEKHHTGQVMLGQARSEGGVRLVGSRWRSVVYDYDLEVAQHSVVSDPVVGVVPLGVELVVQPRALDDGRVLLMTQGRQAHLVAEPRRRATGSGFLLLRDEELRGVAIGDVQHLRVRSRSFQSSGVLGAGSGLLVGNRSASEGPWLITTSRVAQETPWPDDGTRLLRCLDLTAPFMGRPIVGTPPEPTGAGGGLAGFDPGFGVGEEPRAPMTMGRIEELLGVLDQETLKAAAFGQALCLRGDEGALDRASALLEQASTALAPTLEVEVRWGEVDDKQVGSLGEPGEVAERLVYRGHLCARAGDWTGLFAGEEFHYLKDHDIEIAQSSGGPDPVTSVARLGFGFVCRMLRLREDRIRLEGDLFHQVAVNPMRVFETGSDVVGAVDQIDLAHVRANSTWDLVPGAWTILRVGPLSGTGRTFVLVARARLAP